MTKDETIVAIRKTIKKHDFFYDICEELKSNIFCSKVVVSIIASFVYAYFIPFIILPLLFNDENVYSDYKFQGISLILVISFLSFIFLLTIYNRFREKKKKGFLNFIRYISYDLSNLFHIHNVKEVPLHFKVYEKLSKNIKEEEMLTIMEYKLKYSDFDIYYIYSGDDIFYLNRVKHYNKELKDTNRLENSDLLENRIKTENKKKSFVKSLYCTKKDNNK